jgi:sulfofructose kinase
LIVCVGLATRDTIYALPRHPGPDERVVSTDRMISGGGPAATAAVAIARLGVDARFVGVIDRDLDDVEVVRMPGRLVQSTILVTPGARAIVTEEATPFSAPRDALEDADWVHVDHVGYHALPARDVRLSVDGGNPISGLDVSRVDLYSPNRDDGLRGKLTVITRGADGCVAYDGDRVLEEPGERVDPMISTLGAGDVFHGALLAAFAHGLDLPEALHAANRCAALSCRALDGRSAIPEWSEL